MISYAEVLERARRAPTLAHLAEDLGVPVSTLSRHLGRMRAAGAQIPAFPRGGSARLPSALLALSWVWRYPAGRAARLAHRVQDQGGRTVALCGAPVSSWGHLREVRGEALRCPRCWPVERYPAEPGSVPVPKVGGPCEVVARIAPGRARRLVADFDRGLWVDASTGESVIGRVRAIEWWSVWLRFRTETQSCLDEEPLVRGRPRRRPKMGIP